ncbi:MAG: hypothetical protein AB7I37_26280 [Pirellulales bacterium]
MGKDNNKLVCWIIGKWLLESVSSEQLDRLRDHMSEVRLDSDLKTQIADELRLALGYEAFI